MSVDVTDDSTWINLYYADTFTAAPNISSKHGFAMTAVANVSVDLATLFPSSTTATIFTVTALVGNDVDSVQPSIGYVDNFDLTGSGPVPPGLEGGVALFVLVASSSAHCVPSLGMPLSLTYLVVVIATVFFMMLGLFLWEDRNDRLG